MASGGKTTKSQFLSVDKNAPVYMNLAAKDIGKDETKYRKYFNDRIKDKLGIDFDVKSDPWCALWVGIELEDAGVKSTKKANARSYLSWGIPVEEDNWQQGDIIIFWRGSRNDGVTGHVGFLVSWTDDTVTVLGGNQGDKVCLQTYGKSKIIGVRRQYSLWRSKTIQAASAKVAVGAEEVVRNTVNAAPSAETADQTRSLFEQVMQFFPNTGQMVGIVIIALGAYIIYRKIKEKKDV